jgi:hypothetical protein
MKFNRRHFLGVVAAGSTGLVAPRAFAAIRSGEPPALLARAKAALDAHGAAIANRDMIGIVDFSLPSAHPRFHLVDLGNGQVVANYLVSHGRGSDPANSGWVERFSNTPGSNASSRGSYATGDTYYGKHGRSRRLRGLDPENSMAFNRNIVIHAAPYVTPVAAVTSGRIGRSEGCFAVSQGAIGEVLAHLGPGRLLYAWK